MYGLIACTLLAGAPTDPPDAPPAASQEAAPPTQAGFQFSDRGFLIDPGRLPGAAVGPALVLEKLDDAARGQLGVPEGRGLVAVAVRPDGPAWEAGVRERDVLLTLDDQPLAEPADLDRLLRKAGDAHATLALLRKRKPMTLKVQAQVRVELGPVGDDAPAYWIGARVEPVPPLLRDQLDLPEGRGLIVGRLVDDGPASKAGMREHDLVLSVDGEPVSDAAGLVAKVGAAGARPLDFEVLRGGERRTLSVTPEKRPERDVTELPLSLSADSLQLFDVVRPGVIVDVDRLSLSYQPLWNTRDDPTKPAVPGAAPSDESRRIDDLAREVKALRQALESLSEAIKARK